MNPHDHKTGSLWLSEGPGLADQKRNQPMPNQQPKVQQIILVGAGLANLQVVLNARRLRAHGAELTLVNPDGYWYYDGMAAEVLSGRYGVSDFRVDLPKLCRRSGVTFLKDEVAALWPEQQRLITRSGASLAYDLAALATGLIPSLPEGDVPVDGCYSLWPARNVLEVRNEVETLLELETEKDLVFLVLGGGASGVECALNLGALLQERAPGGRWRLQLLEGKGRVLPNASPRASRLAQRALERAGIAVRTGAEIQHIQSGRVVLQQGEIVDYDLAVQMLGSRVSDLYAQAGLLTDEAGTVLVDRTLRVRDFPSLFAAGSCARLWGMGLDPLISHARRQGRLLARNLEAVLARRPLRPYHSGLHTLQVLSLGPQDALAWRGRWALPGRVWLACKHWQDERLVRSLRRHAGGR